MGARLHVVTDPLIELSARLEETAEQLRTGELDPDAAVDATTASGSGFCFVAALEPLPDLPGQLPLPSA